MALILPLAYLKNTFNGDNLGFDEFIINSRVSLREYIKKIKDSLVVFNTPAVLHCHGWKLAEYLALGKVIISTPISRELPEVLIDRRHLLITDGTQNDIEQKINEIINFANTNNLKLLFI